MLNFYNNFELKKKRNFSYRYLNDIIYWYIEFRCYLSIQSILVSELLDYYEKKYLKEIGEYCFSNVIRFQDRFIFLFIL